MLEVISLSSSLNVHALKPLLLPLLSPRARHLDSDTIWRPKSTKWMTKQLGLRSNIDFSWCQKCFVSGSNYSHFPWNIARPVIVHLYHLNGACKKALQPFTGGLCWATLLNTFDTFDTLTATVSLWRDHCCRRLLCRWQRLPFRHVSTASIHTGLQKKVNLDELGLNWWGWLQLISWFDTTWCKYNDRSMTKRSMGPSRFQPHLASYLDLRLVRPHRRTASVQFSYQWLTNVKK